MKIVIAEDQQMLREALTTLLQLEGDIEVVAEVADGDSAWEAIIRYQPDICLLDIEMPIMNGLELARKIRSLSSSMKIIIVTTFARPGYLEQAIELQVEGYLLKDEPIDFLIDAIRRVARGERVMSPELAKTMLHWEKNPLTEREIDVLRLANKGMTTEQISKSLYLSKGTVRNYLSSAIQKLGVETRQQALKKALDKGWI